MKTLILYATKHGATREIAQCISDHLGDTTLYDLKQGNAPALIGFDCIIIGSSLYAGSIRKEAKVFVRQNADQLQAKTLGLFLSGIVANEEQKSFEDNFPEKILQAAKAKALLGGIFDPGKAGVIARYLVKIITKQSGYVDTISNDKIEQFVKQLKI